MSNKVIKKIAIILIIIILFTCVSPLKESNAASVSLDGILNKPITTFFTFCIDSVNLLITMLLKGTQMYNDLQEAFDKSDANERYDVYKSILVDPTSIFKGDVKVLNADIFSANETTSWTSGDPGSLISVLKKNVAATYEIIRNLAAVILLALLIYTGIRIVLASNSAQEKAKWKMILMDWIKALALVIFVHVLMITIFSVSKLITDAISSGTSNGDNYIVLIKKQYDSLGWGSSGLQYWTLVVMYGYITYLTVVFAISYLKRLMYTIVFILIAPIVAVIYALGGQQKQIFGRWFKEFTMNVLIQPYHLLIYTILVSIPLGLVGSTGWDPFSAIYALVALSFIRPAEKMLRDLFGMNQGIAKEASFDSGKAVLDAGKKFVIDTAKVVGGAMTGNVGMAASGAEGLMNGSDANEPPQGGGGPNGPQPGIPPLGDSQQDDWLDETTSEFSEDSDFDNNLLDSTFDAFGDDDGTYSIDNGIDGGSGGMPGYGSGGRPAYYHYRGASLSTTSMDELEDGSHPGIPEGTNGNTLNISTLEVGTLNAKNMGQDKENEKMDLKDGLSEKDLPGNEEKEKMSLADRMAQALLYGNPANIGSGIKDKTGEVKDKLKQTRVAEALGSAKDSFAKTGVGKVTVAGAKRIGAGVRYLRSDAGKERLLEAGKSLDALHQTMYLSGQAPNDTQFFNDAGNHLKASGEAKINQFIENKNNIEYVKKLHGYKDDPTKGTADAQAKARLESASKFLKYGVIMLQLQID